MQDWGELQYYLGIQVINNSDNIKLVQTKYVNDLCARLKISKTVPGPYLPLDPDISLTKSMGPESPDPHLTTQIRELLG
jgi:hypothetical protein